VTGSECSGEIARAPKYVILGKTPHDQEWIDDTTEGLVGGCKQPRPTARPPEWDAPRKAVDTLPPAKPVAKKPTVRDWFLNKRKSE
jgi:hypothetical protein